MADDKKKPDDKPPVPEQTFTLTASALAALVETAASGAADRRVAEILGGKSHDEKMVELMDKQRGKDRPLPKEELVPCKSPITGADFMARLIFSKSFPSGRIVELLDYVRPDGWDKHVSQGGLYQGDLEWMGAGQNNGGSESLTKGQHKYRFWIYSNFWQRDWNTLSGKPGSFIAQWRVTPTAPQVADKAAE
jgi:hypothetical protein